MMRWLPGKNFWLRLDGILEKAVIFGLFCLIFLLVHKAVFDLDIWLHLKAGELIVQQGRVPHSDVFSFPLNGKPWLDHEWLFQVAVYFVYTKWQADGLVLMQSCLIMLSFWVLFLIGRRSAKSYLEIVFLIFMVAYASYTRYNIRPDMISLLFFVLFYYALMFYRNKKTIWLLLPLQVIWVNCHGYFFLGPLLIFFFIFAEFVRRNSPWLPFHWKEEGAVSNKTYDRLKKLLCLAVVFCLVNPYGVRGALYPFFVVKELLLGKVGIFLKHIHELYPTWTRGNVLANFLYFKVLTVFCVVTVAAHFRRLKIIEAILIVFFFLFALSMRNIPFFAVICYCIIITYISGSMTLVLTKLQRRFRLKSSVFVIARVLIACAFILLVWQRIQGILDQSYYDFDSYEFKSFLSGVDTRQYPEKAVTFVLENNFPARMFNDFNSGAYFIGKTFPRRKVFIDGRTELYGPEFFKQYVNMLDNEGAAFDTAEKTYRLEAAFIEILAGNFPALIKRLYKSPQWKLVYFDDRAVVFLKDTSSNRVLLQKFGIDLRGYSFPQADVRKVGAKQLYPTVQMQLAALFNFLEIDDLVVAGAREALRIMPHCAEAYTLLGKVNMRKKQYAQAYENFRIAAVYLPRVPGILVDLGESLCELDDTKSALTYFERALKGNALYAPAYHGLGCVYLKQDNVEKALKVLRRAVQLEAKEPKYYLKLGEALFEKARKTGGAAIFLEAKKQLDKALELSVDKEELKKDILAAQEKVKAAGF
ncbi:MAG: tetratricopeptide repeat protein [Candidatus Omnitrophota bacterium]|jgi:Tfp pilus assembly protein PilF